MSRDTRDAEDVYWTSVVDNETGFVVTWDAILEMQQRVYERGGVVDDRR